jgi:hypothetical protein
MNGCVGDGPEETVHLAGTVSELIESALHLADTPRRAGPPIAGTEAY